VLYVASRQLYYTGLKQLLTSSLVRTAIVRSSHMTTGNNQNRTLQDA
jgi:hypothetical protein